VKLVKIAFTITEQQLRNRKNKAFLKIPKTLEAKRYRIICPL